MTINSDTNEIMWDFVANNIFFPLTGAHIHKAPFGLNGPVVFDLMAMFNGMEHPAGVIRGHVARAEAVPDSSSAAVGALAIGALLAASRCRRFRGQGS